MAGDSDGGSLWSWTSPGGPSGRYRLASCLPLILPACPSVYCIRRPPVLPCVRPSIRQVPIRPFIHPSVRPFIRLSVHPSIVRPSVCVCPPIRPFHFFSVSAFFWISPGFRFTYPSTHPSIGAKSTQGRVDKCSEIVMDPLLLTPIEGTPTGSHYFGIIFVSWKNTNERQPLLTSVTSCQTRQRMRIDCDAEIGDFRLTSVNKRLYLNSLITLAKRYGNCASCDVHAHSDIYVAIADKARTGHPSHLDCAPKL